MRGGPPLSRHRFYASRRNKVEEPREELRASLTKPNPTTPPRAVSLSFTDRKPTSSSVPAAPRRPRSAFHVEERAPLSRESLFIGNRSYSNPPRFLPRTRTDANFFFQSIENRGPEKGFIRLDAISPPSPSRHCPTNQENLLNRYKEEICYGEL